MDLKGINIVGCIMLHDDDKYAKKVLDDMAKYTNRVYVNLNDSTPTIKKIAKGHKSVVKIIETINSGGRWNQGLQRDNTIRMLDDIKPDIVLFPDSDECYPKNMSEQLMNFWLDKDKKTFWFRLLYMWDNEDTFRNDGLFKSIHHVRALKWQPNITYLPKYAGYACPSNYINLPKNTRFHSTAPTFHYGYMHEEDRVRKYGRANCNYCDDGYRSIVDKDKLTVKVPDVLKLDK